METVWDDEKVFKLIEMYEIKSILWDCSSADYKNKTKKNDAWEEVSNDLGVPKKEVESKIHILRSQFARERKKLSSSKTTGMGTADRKQSKWKFYDPLKFLLELMTSIRGSDTINKTGNQENLETELSEPATRSTPMPPQPTTSSQNNLKRKKNEDLNEVIQIIKSAKRKTDESNKDEFDFYGQYVASELRSVNNEKAVLQAKSFINNILIDMRMGKYNYHFENETHPGSLSSPTTSIQELKFEIVSQIESGSESETDISTQY